MRQILEKSTFFTISYLKAKVFLIQGQAFVEEPHERQVIVIAQFLQSGQNPEMDRSECLND